MISLRVIQSGIAPQVSPAAVSLPTGFPRLRAFGGDLPGFGDRAFGYQASISLGGALVCNRLEGNQPKHDLSKRDGNANYDTAFSIEGRKSMEEVLRHSPQ